MDLGLRDRVVLITGGGGGAGPTIGRAFAAEGALVALHHRTGSPSAARAEAAAAGIVAAGGRAIAVNADLRSTEETTAMVERIEAELGTVARARDRHLRLRIRAVRRDLRRVVGCGRRRCPRGDVPCLSRGRARDAGRRLGPDRDHRRAVRAGRGRALRPLRSGQGGDRRPSASLAKELGPSGILVNAIAPTKILTEKDGVPSIPPDKAAEEAKTIPLRRIATPDDLAALAVWLGSGANTYVTGETISLTGGTQR